MKISRWGAARNHGVETKTFEQVRVEWNQGTPEVRIRSSSRKSDFGSGNSEHFYRVTLSFDDLAKALGMLSQNVRSFDEEERKAFRKAVPDLLHLANVLSVP